MSFSYMVGSPGRVWRQSKNGPSSLSRRMLRRAMTPDEVLDADHRKAQAVRFASIRIDARGSGGHHIRHLGVEIHQSIRRKNIVLVGANRFARADDRIAPKDGAPAKEVNSNVLERGQLRMDPERHSCTWKNEPVTLTVTEFLILQALASRPGVVKSRNALMDAAYDDEEYVDDRTIDSHIKRLRIKFKANDVEFDMVETLYGIGYRFKEV